MAGSCSPTNVLLNQTWWCNNSGGSATQCPDSCGCNDNFVPDFSIRRHDTMPPFVVPITDCNGQPIDLTGLVAEASMWSLAKIKTAIAATDTYFALADNIGFEQCLVGDIIVVNRVRVPEQMLITGFDENLKLISVQRGYHGSPVGSYLKGQKIRIFRVLNAFASTQLIKNDIVNVDGTTSTGVITESDLVYNWSPNDTCVPGCYYLEFKLLQMNSSTPLMYNFGMDSVSQTPSFVSFTPSEAGCDMGVGVNWVRRYPVCNEGYNIRVFDSPTSETLFA